MVGRQSLHYDIAVEAGQETALEIDWDLDTHLVVSPPWVGLALTEPADADHLLRYARALARLGGRDQVQLYGIVESCEHVVVTGVRLDLAGGEHARVARVLLDNNRDRDLLRVLARYLVLGETSPEVLLPGVPDGCARTTTVAAAPTRHTRHLWPAYAAATVGALAIAGGVYLVLLDGTGTCGASSASACPRRLHHRDARLVRGRRRRRRRARLRRRSGAVTHHGHEARARGSRSCDAAQHGADGGTHRRRSGTASPAG